MIFLGLNHTHIVLPPNVLSQLDSQVRAAKASALAPDIAEVPNVVLQRHSLSFPLSFLDRRELPVGVAVGTEFAAVQSLLVFQMWIDAEWNTGVER